MRMMTNQKTYQCIYFLSKLYFSFFYILNLLIKQLIQKRKSKKAKLSDTQDKPDKPDELNTKKTEDLWSSFLNDVKTSPKKNNVTFSLLYLYL